jgi:hypothetical protein
MALVAAEALPGYRTEILTVAIGSTIVFELVGPAATARMLQRAGETGRTLITAGNRTNAPETN